VRAHGWAGLAVIVAAEACLAAGQPVVSRWFTPIVWTGYILLVDALVARWTGQSYLTTARAELVLLALVSIGCWWLFEWYDAPRFWRGGADRAGLWWILTAALLRASLFRRVPVRARRPPPGLLNLAMALGAVCVVLPLLVVSAWLVPLVWTGFILLLEPLNYRRGRPSWLAGVGAGDASLVLALLTSGAICGVLWEFWNYWAATKWTYTVPYLGDVKVFEMPVLGYLGFPPFALECYAMYHALRGALGRLPAPLLCGV